MKKLPSKVSHNRPRPFFSVLSIGPQPAQISIPVSKKPPTAGLLYNDFESELTPNPPGFNSLPQPIDILSFLHNSLNNLFESSLHFHFGKYYGPMCWFNVKVSNSCLFKRFCEPVSIN